MAAKVVAIPEDHIGNEIRNAVIHPLVADPGTPANGQIWVNISTWTLNVRLNGVTIALGRLDQLNLPTASVNLNSQRIINSADPVSAQDLATMQWVTNLVTGQLSAQDWKAAVRMATTAALPSNTYASGPMTLTATANGALTVDGVGATVADRVLVKNEATASHDGLFVVTAAGGAGAPYVLTRTSDANTSALVNKGMTVPVLSGTVNADTLWLQTTDSVTLDTSSLAFSQIGAAGATYTAASPITLVGNQFGLSTVPVTLGGTNATTASAARANLGTVSKFPATGPSSGGLTWTVNHNLGTQDFTYMLRDATSNAEVIADVVATDANNATVTFGFTVSANAYKIVIIG